MNRTMNDAGRPPRYQKPVPTFWWLRRRSYLLFALRELSCLSVAWLVVFLLLLVTAVGGGEERYRQFVTGGAEPPVLITNVTALLFVVLHAVTWFNQTPSAIAIRLRGRRVPRNRVIMSMYLLWVVSSALAAWIVIGG